MHHSSALSYFLSYFVMVLTIVADQNSILSVSEKKKLIGGDRIIEKLQVSFWCEFKSMTDE